MDERFDLSGSVIWLEQWVSSDNIYPSADSPEEVMVVTCTRLPTGEYFFRWGFVIPF